MIDDVASHAQPPGYFIEITDDSEIIGGYACYDPTLFINRRVRKAHGHCQVAPTPHPCQINTGSKSIQRYDVPGGVRPNHDDETKLLRHSDYDVAFKPLT
jgi:hypothetical protein